MLAEPPHHLAHNVSRETCPIRAPVVVRENRANGALTLVDWRLLTDAKTAENSTEQIVSREFARDFGKCGLGEP